MMFPKFILSALLAASAIASPLTLQKRDPVIPEIKGYSNQHTTQIKDAFSDAYHLAMNALGAPDDQFDKVFKKCFNMDDKNTVKGESIHHVVLGSISSYQTILLTTYTEVFKKILGSYPTDNPGNPLIKDISVVEDYKHDDDGSFTCNGRTMAEIRDWWTDHPKIIICDGAGLNHGGIRKGYKNVKAVDCDNLDKRVSWKMDTLGATVLHELTHWRKLVVPPLKESTYDERYYYGCEGARNLPKEKSTNIGDQYNWFASELLWTMSCGKDYAEPTRKSAKDPHCKSSVCVIL